MTVLTVIAIVVLGLAAIVCLGAGFILARYHEPGIGKVLAVLAALTMTFTYSYIAVHFADELRMQAATARPELPPGFVYMSDLVDTKLRFAGPNNITGQVVDGYLADNVSIVRTDLAIPLIQVQSDLAKQRLELRISDAYRPARANQFLLSWAQTPDTSTKVTYYPDLDKRELVELGYLVDPSAHSSGYAVDVTLVDRNTGQPLDMGSPIDFFGPVSRPDAKGLSTKQQRNRATLSKVMQAHGFRQDRLVWWQFSYPSSAVVQPEDFEIR